MNLRYIALGIDSMSLGFSGKRPRLGYASEFGYRTSFISNYLSRQIRKVRFRTDGTFHMIYVEATQDNPEKCTIVPERALTAQIRFDKVRYEHIKGTTDCEYYLEMLEEGFCKAAEFKAIPLETLLGLIDEFRKGGCKNEWLHKKKRFKEADIEVALNCYFTTLEFRLVATIKRISTKKELCSGIVLKTDPDEIHFDYKFKDILLDEKNIIITDFLDEPNILIDLKRALNRELSFEQLPDDDEEDEEGDENRNSDPGMIKLYRKQNGTFRYYEAWGNDQEVIVHWGELGQVGDSKTVFIAAGETAGSVIERELSSPRSQGYKEIDIDDHKTLVIQYKTDDGANNADLDKRHEVENLVNESLGWTGNGHCDGGQIGSGSMEIFAYVVDPHIACRSLVNALDDRGLLRGAVIAYENDKEEYDVLHPETFKGGFKML